MHQSQQQQQYEDYDRIQRMRHVAYVDNNLWFGSAQGLNPKTITELQIDEVFHFVPLASVDKVAEANYREYILEDNTQSAAVMMAIATEIYDSLLIAMAAGKKTMVCCSQGKSRSAAMIVYYLMHRYGLSFDVAYERLKTVRGCVNINPGFSLYLLTC